MGQSDSQEWAFCLIIGDLGLIPTVPRWPGVILNTVPGVTNLGVPLGPQTNKFAAVFRSKI